MVSYLHKAQEECNDLRDIYCVAGAVRWYGVETQLISGNEIKYSSFIRKAGWKEVLQIAKSFRHPTEISWENLTYKKSWNFNAWKSEPLKHIKI